MKSESKLGMNVTGIATSPIRSKEMISGTEELTLPRSPEGDAESIGNNRISYMNKKEALGSIPPPTTVKGMLKSGIQALSGVSPTLLIDKLSERLAFERSGIRLYEALISKFKFDQADLTPIVSLEALEELKNEELHHFNLVREVIQNLGADPTVMSPAADISALNSMGIGKTLADPRINFVQSLNGILIAELTDNDCWQLLIQLTTQAGLSEISESFIEAFQTEQRHLATIRKWVQEFNTGARMETAKITEAA